MLLRHWSMCVRSCHLQSRSSPASAWSGFWPAWLSHGFWRRQRWKKLLKLWWRTCWESKYKVPHHSWPWHLWIIPIGSPMHSNASFKTSEAFLGRRSFFPSGSMLIQRKTCRRWVNLCRSPSYGHSNCEELRLLQLVHHTALYVAAAFLAEVWIFYDYTL